MRREFDSLEENNTFEWQKVPRNKNIFSSRWFFTIKSKSDGNYEYIARFIAKGYTQIYGKDYKETFASTTNMVSMRLLLQIAVQYDLLNHHMDVKSVYLNSPLYYEIYIEPLEGFKKVRMGTMFGNIKKSLYGLKQSGRTWKKTFHTYITTQKFVQLPVNPCMYVQNVHNQISIILLWVDDILIASKTEAHLM